MHELLKDGGRSLLKQVQRLAPEQKAVYAQGDDIAVSRLFGKLFQDWARYDETARCWRIYDGICWTLDREGLVIDSLAMLFQRVLMAHLKDEPMTPLKSYIQSLAKNTRRRQLLDDAKSWNAVKSSDFDRQPELLNCLNCVVDLRYGGSFPHDPALMLSKVANVNFDPEAKSPLWEDFIREIMSGDQEKAVYVQKILGYSLTGANNQEELYMFYGSSTRNGKSTLCDTFRHLMGDYGASCQPETLAQKDRNSASASGDLARLSGVRFLQCAEPPKRMVFDIALLKTLTGRDSITARHLYEREFEFVPAFKLVMNCNYLPVVGDDTLFSSGRVKVVEFSRHFGPEEQDVHLKDQLRQPQVLSAILNWALEGLKLYREDDESLLAPRSVQAATEKYREASDKIGTFLSEALIPDPNGRLTAKTAYVLYTQWCKDSGYGVEGKKNFLADLRSKGVLHATAKLGGKVLHNVLFGYTADLDAYGNLKESTFSA